MENLNEKVLKKIVSIMTLITREYRSQKLKKIYQKIEKLKEYKILLTLSKVEPQINKKVT